MKEMERNIVFSASGFVSLVENGARNELGFRAMASASTNILRWFVTVEQRYHLLKIHRIVDFSILMFLDTVTDTLLTDQRRNGSAIENSKFSFYNEWLGLSG